MVYRLYIDESGDHTYKNLASLDKRYLCLLGMIVEAETYRRSFHPAVEALKQKHFPHDPDNPIVLHRREIVNRSGYAWRLRDPAARKAFNEDLLQFLRDQDYRLIAVVMDKKNHVERYGDAAFHPYHYSLAILLERYCGLLNYLNAKGDVMVERRGKREDALLMRAYEALYDFGTWYRGPEFFRSALTSRNIKIKSKEANIAGLQIADLLAYPCKQEILRERVY